jgi:hypothetical protein
MNKIICSDITIRFLGGKVSTLSFYVKPEANFIPPHELKEEDLQKSLRGFPGKQSFAPRQKGCGKSQIPVPEKPSPQTIGVLNYCWQRLNSLHFAMRYSQNQLNFVKTSYPLYEEIATVDWVRVLCAVSLSAQSFEVSGVQDAYKGTIGDLIRSPLRIKNKTDKTITPCYPEG